MDICSSGHEEVCFDARKCPACEVCEELESVLKELKQLQEEVKNG